MAAKKRRNTKGLPEVRERELVPIEEIREEMMLTKSKQIGPFTLGEVYEGDCLDLARLLPEASIDVIVTSPPYWGQRTSNGVGVEDDPRDYVARLTERFLALRPALKTGGLLWINIGDSYNTPVNWRHDDHKYSSLGPGGDGLDPRNSAYTKPRLKRRQFVDQNVPWLQYGNLLALPYRLVVSLCDSGYLFRGEVVWRKGNPMPEGKCRRPHRAHEGIYLFAKYEQHDFQVSPPVKSVWEFPNEGLNGVRHYSRFPTALPRRCIEAYGQTGAEVVVLDPFSGAATTGIASLSLGCSYLGFEIDRGLVEASNNHLRSLAKSTSSRLF
ncbi:MAG: site-specific DNA-methyltransferase [Planctomycetia bacterium]|nr:site-specific DNA-methyltransferase [Planctomycetia bacterium]